MSDPCFNHSIMKSQRARAKRAATPYGQPSRPKEEPLLTPPLTDACSVSPRFLKSDLVEDLPPWISNGLANVNVLSHPEEFQALPVSGVKKLARPKHTADTVSFSFCLFRSFRAASASPVSDGPLVFLMQLFALSQDVALWEEIIPTLPTIRNCEAP